MQPTLSDVGTAPLTRRTVREALLACGVVSSLLYVGADLLAAARWADYSYLHQTVSELMAIRAPTRPLLLVLFSAYDLLVLAFAIGIWLAAGPSRAQRAAAVLLLAWTLTGWLSLLFAPMHLRGEGFSSTDVMHIVSTAVASLLLLGCIGLAAAALRKAFRIYSIATIAVLLLFGGLTSLRAPLVPENLPTPWIGALERVNVYGTMLWLLVLAVVLLRRSRGGVRR